MALQSTLDLWMDDAQQWPAPARTMGRLIMEPEKASRRQFLLLKREVLR